MAHVDMTGLTKEILLKLLIQTSRLLNENDGKVTNSIGAT
jgi:hypothetical protein